MKKNTFSLKFAFEKAKNIVVIVCLSIILLFSITPLFEAQAQPIPNGNFANPTQVDTEDLSSLFDLSKLFTSVICPFNPTEFDELGRPICLPSSQLSRQERLLVSRQRRNVDEIFRKTEIAAKLNIRAAQENPALLKRKYEEILEQGEFSQRQKNLIKRLVSQKGGIVEFAKSSSEKILVDLPQEKSNLSKVLEEYSDPSGETSRAKPSSGWCNLFSNFFVVAVVQGNVPGAVAAGAGVVLYCEL